MLSPKNVRVVALDVPDLPLDALLAAAYAVGASKGSSRSGVFEVQTDLGIWDRQDGGKLAPGRAARFTSWDDLAGAA